MLKLIARVVLPILAATTVAQAADLTAGRITYVNPESHQVLVDNIPVQLAANANLSGFGIGEYVNVAYPLGRDTGARIAAYAPVVTEISTGRITSIRPGAIVVNNAVIQVPGDIDLAKFQIGRVAEVTMTSVAGFNTAHAISQNQIKLASAMMGKTQDAAGRITYVDFVGRQVVMDNSTWLQVPESVDLNKLRVGDFLAASIASTSGINVFLTRLASL